MMPEELFFFLLAYVFFVGFYIHGFYKVVGLKYIKNWKLRWLILFLMLLASCFLAWGLRNLILLIICFVIQTKVEFVTFASTNIDDNCINMMIDFAVGAPLLWWLGLSNFIQHFIKRFYSKDHHE